MGQCHRVSAHLTLTGVLRGGRGKQQHHLTEREVKMPAKWSKLPQVTGPVKVTPQMPGFLVQRPFGHKEMEGGSREACPTEGKTV